MGKGMLIPLYLVPGGGGYACGERVWERTLMMGKAGGVVGMGECG